MAHLPVVAHSVRAQSRYIAFIFQAVRRSALLSAPCAPVLTGAVQGTPQSRHRVLVFINSAADRTEECFEMDVRFCA